MTNEEKSVLFKYLDELPGSTDFKDDNTKQLVLDVADRIKRFINKTGCFEHTVTNLEYYMDPLKTIMSTYSNDFDKCYLGIRNSLDLGIDKIPAGECPSDDILTWLAQPQRHFNRLTQQEYELLRTEIPVLTIGKLKHYQRLHDEFGWFKDVDMNIMVQDILRYCEIIGNEEKSDENS